MKEIIKNIISSASNSLSSKRLLSIYFAILWLLLIILQANSITVSDSVVYSTAGLIAGLQGFTLFDSKSK